MVASVNPRAGLKALVNSITFFAFLFIFFVPCGTINVARADIVSNLVGHWQFDEGTGATTVDAGSGNHNGTLVGSPAWVAGKVGAGALDFSSSGKTVTTGYTYTSYPLSACAWINPSATGGINYIIASNRFNLIFQGFGSNTIQLYNGVASANSANQAIALNAWQYVCATVSSANIGKVYVNGALVASRDIGAAPSNSAFVFGNGFPGKIDDIRIYGRELSMSEVNALYYTTQGLTPDTANPVISSVASSTTSLSATVTWTTDEPATTQVFYGLSPTYTSSTTLATATTTSHSALISNLSPSTTYYFQAASTDPSGNTATTSALTFTTAPLDVTAPAISSISAGTPAVSSTSISWITDEQANATVYYGTTTSYGLSTSSAPYVTSRSLTIRGLTASTTYNYIVVSADETGNVSTSSNQTFVTPAFKGGNVIPSARLVEWAAGINVGVPGGIPTRSTLIDVTASPYNADKTGSTNTVSAINSAISAAGSGSVVYLPAGTYRIDTPIGANVFGSSKSNYTIRGEGVSNTLIDCRVVDGACILAGSGADYQWNFPASGNVVTGGNYKGSETLAIASTSSFSVGQMVRLQITNDSSIPIIDDFGYDNSRIQMARVTAKTPTTLSIYPGLYDDYSRSTVTVRAATVTGDSIGVEDLMIDAENGSTTYGVYMEQTYGSWVKNVKIRKSINYNVSIANSLGCEIRDNYLAELDRTGGTNGAGILMAGTSGCLTENNVIIESFPNIEVNHGASGNVFGYNFMNNASGNIGIDTNHSPHNTFNLYEGNIVHNLQSDGYFGGESNATLFRNWLTGNKLSLANVPASTYCISLKRFTRNFSLVGNLLGSDAVTMPNDCDTYGQPNIGNGSSSGTAQPSLGSYWADWNPTTGTTIAGTLTTRSTNTTGTVTLTSGSLSNGQVPRLIWNGGAVRVTVTSVVGSAIGVSSNLGDGNLPTAGTALSIWAGPAGFQELDLDVEATTLKKGNYRYFSSSILAGESLGGQTLADSLYRNEKPSWFGSLSWPAFEPTAPSSNYSAIPAGARYFAATTATSTASAPPTVTTQAASAVSITSATFNGNITSIGSSTATTRGFAYGLTTEYDATTTAFGLFSTGAYTSAATGLSCNTLYHVRAYAANAAGASYGGDVTFTTSACVAPTVSTSAATSLAANSATLNANLSSVGGAAVTTRGFAYGLSTAYGATTTESGSFSAETFSASASSLTCNTLYHVRAYATNSVGTSYGSDATFTTAACAAPTVVASAATSITLASATLNGSISSVGDATVTARGFEYGLTTAYGSTTGSVGSFSTGSFSASVLELSCNTLYHVRAYATNSIGTAYSADSTFTAANCLVNDTDPPVLSSGSPSGRLSSGTTMATLYVETDEAATCRFDTVAHTAYDSLTGTMSAAGGIAHAQTVSDLVDGGSYAYYVRCSDASNNTNSSDYTISFTIDTPRATVLRATRSTSGGGGGGGGGSGGFYGYNAPSEITGTIGVTAVSTVSSRNQSLLQLIDLLIASGIIPPSKAFVARAAVVGTAAASNVSALPAVSFSRDLKVLDTGPDVKALQKYLNSHGFIVASSGPGSVGYETEKFGAATYVALKAYQAAKGLPATGYFGSLTRASMR